MRAHGRKLNSSRRRITPTPSLQSLRFLVTSHGWLGGTGLRGHHALLMRLHIAMARCPGRVGLLLIWALSKVGLTIEAAARHHLALRWVIGLRVLTVRSISLRVSLVRTGMHHSWRAAARASISICLRRTSIHLLGNMVLRMRLGLHRHHGLLHVWSTRTLGHHHLRLHVRTWHALWSVRILSRRHAVRSTHIRALRIA